MLHNQLHPDRNTIATEARIAQAFDIVQRCNLFDHLPDHARLEVARIKLVNGH